MFSVIVADFEGSVQRDVFRRKMACLAAQSCKDFEVLVYHDGPKTSSYDADVSGIDLHPATRFHVTETRANDWGHSNRDRGIRAAAGEWIIHTNADNVLYPDLIARLKVAAEGEVRSFLRRRKPVIVQSILKRLDRLLRTSTLGQQYSPATRHEILIFAVLMRGLVPAGRSYRRVPDLAGTHGLIFGGVPVEHGQIDLMQFVMRRDLWLHYGGWHDRHEEGDGRMYVQLARKHAVTAIPEVLGEHW